MTEYAQHWDWERLHKEAMNTHKQKKATVKIGLPQRPRGNEAQKVGSQAWNYGGSSEESQAVKNKKNTIRVDIAKGKNMEQQGKETIRVAVGATQQVAPATARAAPQPPPQKKPDVVPNAVQKLVQGEHVGPVTAQQLPVAAPPIEKALAGQAPVAAPVPPPVGAPVGPPVAPPVAISEVEQLRKEIEELKSGERPHPLLPDQGVGTSPEAPAPQAQAVAGEPPSPDEGEKKPTQAILVDDKRLWGEFAENLAARLHVLTRKSQWVDFGLAFVAMLVSIALLIVLMRI
jgi:hypothetical protein